MIQIKIGNIFDSKKSVLVNTVNCVGVMGKGIAKDFKEKFPLMYEEYKNECDHNRIRTGMLYPYYENGEVRVINFPTKQHWRSPSKLSYVIDGLNWFIDNYQSLNIKSIAFPPLGCGNGGLSWEIVGPIMYQKLSQLDIDLEIYAPFGVASDQLQVNFLSRHILSGYEVTKSVGKVEKNWLIALQIVKDLERSKYGVKVGRVMFQKICYILTRYGADLNLKFEKGLYGPYCKEINNMISILSNNNLIQERQVGKMILLETSKNFKFSKNDYSEVNLIAGKNTYSLFRGIKNSAQSEILTTILFSYDNLKQEYNVVTENMLYEYINKWKSRNKNFKNENCIRDFIKNLTYSKLIDVDYSKDFVESLLF